MAHRSGGRDARKGLGAFDRLDPFHILDLGEQERVDLGLGIDAWQFKLGDRFDGAHAVNGRQEGGDIAQELLLTFIITSPAMMSVAAMMRAAVACSPRIVTPMRKAPTAPMPVQIG
jgi:hypothetical protein